MNINRLLTKLSKFRIKFFFQNLIYLFRYSIKNQINYENKLLELELKYELQLLKYELLYFKLIDYYVNNPSKVYQAELEFIKTNGKLTVFPYPQIKSMDSPVEGYDTDKQMPYVVHCSKRLYFPRSWSRERARNTYQNYIKVENLLGGDYTTKAPHKYQSDKVIVKDGDTVVDIGAAEALFALDSIDLARRVIVIEGDESWFDALKATFEPYQHKVQIINQYISSTVSDTNCTFLSDIIDIETVDSLFIKMDIEGNECAVLEANKDFFDKAIDVRVACCTYHNQNDANTLEKFFKDKNYYTEFSEGYMLFYPDEHIQPPYFRKGIIRAKKC